MTQELTKRKQITPGNRNRVIVYLKEFAKLLPIFGNVFSSYYNNKNRNKDNKFKEDVLGLLEGVRKVVESDMDVTRTGKSGNIMRVPINKKYEVKVFLTYDRSESHSKLNSMGVKGLNVYDKSKGKVYKIMTVVNENDNLNFKLDVDDFKIIHGNRVLESAVSR